MLTRRLIGVLAVVGMCTSCGTYSLLRPADTLKRGQFDIGVGLAASGLGEVVGVARIHVGITDWLEAGVHYEVYSALGEARFRILSSEKHGFALAIGVGGGVATQIRELLDSLHGGAMMASLTAGRRWDWFDLYLGHRLIYLPELGSTINATKLGVRATVSKRFVLGVEGGATLHHGVFWIGEAAATIGVTF